MSEVPFMFKDAAEWEAWKAEEQSVFKRANKLADDVDARILAAKADGVSALGGGILGSALPEEVVEVILIADRIAGFLPFVPDSMKPLWADKLAGYLGLIKRGLGL